MKSLKERLAEKAERQAKEDAKLSGPVKCFVVRIPWCGAPDVRKDSDLKFLQQRASEVVAKIRHNAAYQFYEAMKNAIGTLERNAAARRRPDIWPRAVDPASTFVQVNLNPNGTITDNNGRVYSPNDSCPPSPQGIRGVLNENGRVFTADGTGNQYMTEFAMMPVITPTVPTPPTPEERPLHCFTSELLDTAASTLLDVAASTPPATPPTGVAEAVSNLLNGEPGMVAPGAIGLLVGEALSHTVDNNLVDLDGLSPEEGPVNLSAEEMDALRGITPEEEYDLTPEEEAVNRGLTPSTPLI
jgi:hypothetical protein